MPAPSLNWAWRCTDILVVGVRLPRRQRWVARAMAMAIRDRMYPQTCKYGRSHLWAIFIASRVSSALVSLPRRPSAKIFVFSPLPASPTLSQESCSGKTLRQFWWRLVRIHFYTSSSINKISYIHNHIVFPFWREVLDHYYQLVHICMVSLQQ